MCVQQLGCRDELWAHERLAERAIEDGLGTGKETSHVLKYRRGELIIASALSFLGRVEGAVRTARNDIASSFHVYAQIGRK
jgi:hypothetical protein